MRCEQNQLLSAYIDGELSAVEAGQVRDHLTVCAACAAEARDLRAVGLLMVAAVRDGMADPDEDVMARLKLHVRDLVETVDTSLVWMARVFSGVAASVLVGGLWLMSQSAGTPSTSSQGPVEQVAIRSLLIDPVQPEQASAVSTPTTREAVLNQLMGFDEVATAEGAGEAELP